MDRNLFSENGYVVFKKTSILLIQLYITNFKEKPPQAEYQDNPHLWGLFFEGVYTALMSRVEKQIS